MSTVRINGEIITPERSKLECNAICDAIWNLFNRRGYKDRWDVALDPSGPVETYGKIEKGEDIILIEIIK